MKAIIEQVFSTNQDVDQAGVTFAIYSDTDFVCEHSTLFTLGAVVDSADFRSKVIAAILDYSTVHSLDLSDETDILYI